MGSTARNDTRRALFLERLARSWDKRPDLTFGEILGGAFKADVFEHMTDDVLAQVVEHFVDPDPEPEPDTQR